jgi:hypothetical protein
MNELTNEERKLLEWVVEEVKSQYYSQPLESLADVCESVDLGLAPEGLERPYYGMSYKHQVVFLAEYIKALEE